MPRVTSKVLELDEGSDEDGPIAGLARISAGARRTTSIALAAIENRGPLTETDCVHVLKAQQEAQRKAREAIRAAAAEADALATRS